MSHDLITRLIKQLPPTGVETFGTLTELIAAADSGSLEEGYYVVTGGGVYYWNGSAFGLPLADNVDGYIQLPTSGIGIYLPDIVTNDASIITLLGPAYGFPGITDYVGLFTDAELSTATTLASSRRTRGMSNSYSRRVDQYPYKASLVIPGELCIKTLFYVTRDFTTAEDIEIGNCGGSGETSDTNFTYKLSLRDDNINAFTESGAGVDCTVEWYLPFFPKSGQELLIDHRRNSSMGETMWINGQQLRYITANTAGTVDNTTGTFTRVTPTDGSSGILGQDGLGDSNAIDIFFLSIGNSVTTPPSPTSFASSLNIAFSNQELFDFNYDVDVTAETGIVSSFKAIASGVQDATGNVTSWSTNTIATQRFIGDDTDSKYWATSGLATVTNVPLRIKGDLTINAVIAPKSSGSRVLAEIQATGETSATNFLYNPSINTTTGLIGMFYEYGAGVNVTVTWTYTGTWQVNEIREIRWVREEIGGSQCYWRCFERLFGSDTWTQLTVASVTGNVGVGTTQATAASTAASTATSTVFQLGDSTAPYWRQIDFYNVAVDPI